MHHKDFDIVPFDRALLPAFQQLNRIWIERFFRIEPEDERELLNAEELLVNNGGQVFFALEKGAERKPENVLGCVGVYKRAPDFYEMIKLAVADHAQGRGLGRILTQTAIDFIASQGANRVCILSSRKLGPAISLYNSMGFVETEFGYKELFERCDIELVLPLEQKKCA